MGATGPPAAAAAATWATLHLLESGQALQLTGSDEFTIGRITERQPIPPDIDLSAYHALSSGVSRRHATIRRRGSRVVLLDLDSANGTYVNGKRLGPRQEEPLASGDVIALGKLKIQVLLKTA
jgi:pSer/pThr/pTyr-binding forkhead associated (FHA) protein